MTPVFSLDELQAAVRKGKRFRYRFFWSHKLKTPGVLSEACFSQWFASPFTLHGQRYGCAEQWMMASKARLFDDPKTLAEILAAQSPEQIKALGRQVRGFDEARWGASRFSLVVEGNQAKFSQAPSLRAFLLSTGQDVLAEASPLDRIWGIGLAAERPEAQNPLLWRGLNLLGFALMRVREALRDQRQP